MIMFDMWFDYVIKGYQVVHLVSENDYSNPLQPQSIDFLLFL